MFAWFVEFQTTQIYNLMVGVEKLIKGATYETFFTIFTVFNY